ncbi:MAG: hypothetical protein K1563_05240 [Candidatus Thiodiazotropha sp. (ex. Lucinisca nassula)]|nr:hypothetical protein [Candidatus Thiodiazotropha sp. (ex. Lucinisca nassula)]MBW9273073.1 hypothetical protein [Candidatus Thiodiazotropha sp. (ex. Lucinisca nassula)]
MIEEIQMNNLVTAPQSPLMQNFLLSLLNSGIPIIFVGNPMGFTWTEKFSQGIRRLNCLPEEFIHPCEQNSSDWNSVFFGVKQYYVLDIPIRNESELSNKLHRYSGGIPDLALILWRRAQQYILFGEMPERKTRDLLYALKKAYSSSEFDELRALAVGFANKKYNVLQKFVDVPWRYYKDKWNNEEDDAGVVNGEKEQAETESKKEEAGKVVKPKGSDKAKLKAEQTRNQTQKNKRQELRARLDQEDLRHTGVKAALLAGMEESMKDLDEKLKNT